MSESSAAPVTALAEGVDPPEIEGFLAALAPPEEDGVSIEP